MQTRNIVLAIGGAALALGLMLALGRHASTIGGAAPVDLRGLAQGGQQGVGQRQAQVGFERQAQPGGEFVVRMRERHG